MQLPGRRRFIRYLAAVSALALAKPSVMPAVAQLRSYPFGLGVASGSPTPDGIVLWTRLVGSDIPDGQSIPVEWEVYEDGAPQQIVARGWAQAVPELAYSVHVEIAGLQADRWYGYRFLVSGFESPPGRTRTLPPLGATTTACRIAFASCQRWEDGNYAAYRHMLADAPDYVLFLGDYIYEYASRRQSDAVRTHKLGRIRSLQGYRDRYALYRSDPALQQMHAACAWSIIWDDHEVENNYAGLITTAGTNGFGALRRAAYQAFYEHMPIRRDVWLQGVGNDDSGGLRLYDKLDIGNLARMYLLDNRQYRDRPLCGASPDKALASVCNSMPTQARTMLGLPQEQWLSASLRESATQQIRWNLVCQQTRFTPSNYHRGVGAGYSPDTWDGYADARQRLLDALRESGASNPVVLGGDIHQNWVAHVHADPYDVQSEVVAAEFCGTSIASRSGASASSNARAMRNNPHCMLADARYRGYSLVDMSRDSLEVKLRAVEDVARLDSPVITLAAFRLLAGKLRIERLA